MVVPRSSPPFLRRSVTVGHLLSGVVLGTGLGVVVLALFLPWLRSGPTTRNSFELMGLADRYTLVDSWWYRVAPTVWPFWGPVVVIALALLVLRYRRTAAGLGLIIGLLACGIGILVLVRAAGRRIAGVSLADIGPMTLAAGGALAIIGSGTLFLASATQLQIVGRSGHGADRRLTPDLGESPGTDRRSSTS